MKLQKLIIKNFRGLKGEKNIIDFSKSNIIFLIGQNNAGKSSFLRGYEFFVNSSQKAALSDFFNYDINEPIVIEGVFLKEQADETDDELKGKGKSEEPDWVNKWVDADNLVRIRKVWKMHDEAFEKYTFSPQTDSWIMNGFGGMQSLFTKYSPTAISISAMESESSLEDKVNKLIQDDVLKKLREDYPDDFSKLVTGVKDLQKKVLGSDIVSKYNDEINEQFKKVFADLTLKIDPKNDEYIKLEDAFKKNHSVNIRKDGIDRDEVFTQYGHGVIRQALYNFISFLKKTSSGTRKSYIILFEEPELFLHPEAAFRLRKSLYDLAENSPFQILIATHSPLMIDISKPHTSLVRIVKHADESTEAYQVDDDVFRGDEEKKDRIQMINRFNPHICESFYAKNVIIVEGDTEAIVFRDLIGRFYNQYEVYVLNSGTKNNIPFFQEIFTAFHIQHCVIHDSDSRTIPNGNANSAWSLNESIWRNIELSNAKKNGLARRYVHIGNFEVAHDVQLTGKDKPLKAYEYVVTLDQDSDVPCLKILKDLFGDQVILHDKDFVDGL
ncbi:ATP-dependent nuclease [Mucilaginibacter ginsenosidivorax]|uniref:ATP-dependent endonuclease n=1 Tax=Mucilaginibacter ginsenosidivorax TaxID=862126 RepID=A0A5B8VSK9_9SPHI|nr:AAA family ATPase [Mucilaginibacter ginsenosidivorax]QEC74624.1 ATP-dependent endonuclease [Mucilaginibacter ginsenosidivorax]